MSDDAVIDGGHILDKEETKQEADDKVNLAAQDEKAEIEAKLAEEGKGRVTAHFDFIEKSARALAKAIEDIPEGIQHGWHAVAAEINARVK